MDSPLQGTWPSPAISRVFREPVRIPNGSNEPIYLCKSGHFAQIRRVITPTVLTIASSDILPPDIIKPVIGPTKHLAGITVDPDHQMSFAERSEFHKLHSCYDNVFNKNFGAYNGGITR